MSDERLPWWEQPGAAGENRTKEQYDARIAALKEPNQNRSKKPHRVMTPEEYAAMPLKGWHEVCRDVDGFGGVGIRYLATGALVSTPRGE